MNGTLLEWPTFSSVKGKRKVIKPVWLKKKIPSVLQDSGAYFSFGVTLFLSHKPSPAPVLILTSCYFLCQAHSWSWTAFIKLRKFPLGWRKRLKYLRVDVQVDPIIFGSFFAKYMNISTSLWEKFFFFFIYLICFNFAVGLEFSSGKGRQPHPICPT